MPTLNWIGKDKVTSHHLDVPLRILDKTSSFGDPGAARDNRIIHGDNLAALKALMPECYNLLSSLAISLLLHLEFTFEIGSDIFT